jgi:signal transduction histidine kinase
MAKSLEEIENLRRSLMIDVAHELRTPHGGSLEIHVVPRDGRVQVALTNTAENIRPEDIPFIFERFFRGEKSRSREHGGAGIGLAIVKELVEAHGGSVGARLEEDRVRIWFELPA